MMKKEKINISISRNLLITRLFGLRHIVLPIISILILGIIMLLSYLFISTERDAIIRKTEEMCISTAKGLAGAAVESIVQERRGIVLDYIQDLKSFSIQGLANTYVIEYEGGRVNGSHVIYRGSIIGSLDIRDIGKTITGQELADFMKVRELKLSVRRINGKTYYVYYYPIIWKVVKNGKTSSFTLGMIMIEFLEKELLKTFYSAMTVTIGISLTAFLITMALVGMNMILTGRLDETLEKVRQLSVTDELTKIFNRKKFDEVLHEQTVKFKRYSRPLSLIMFDIDHFKNINDTYGHDAGDDILKEVVSTVKPLIREADLFARWGGEEFMILTPDTGKSGACEFAERIRVKISGKDFTKVSSLTCSFGVSTFLHTDTLDDFLKRVDTALYNAKKGGRNRVAVI